MNIKPPRDGLRGLVSRSPIRTSSDPLAQGRVLIVEDDEVLSRFLQNLLQAEGFQATCAHDGSVAIEAANSDPDLILLDLNLPTLDGIDFLRWLRPHKPQVPVLVLTGRSRSECAALALESGADDCVIKPFSCVELTARIRALLRRSKPSAQTTSSCGDLTLSRNEMRVTRNGKRVDLTPREFAMLELLMRTPRIPVRREVLVSEIWGEKGEGSSNVVDVYMKYVRDKVDLPGLPKLIHTVRGVGYVVTDN